MTWYTISMPASYDIIQISITCNIVGYIPGTPYANNGVSTIDYQYEANTDVNVINFVNNYETMYAPYYADACKVQVEAKADEVFQTGFTVPTGTGGTLAGSVLQVRDTIDKTNWLTSQINYQAAVNAGQGATVNASFRTANNSTIIVSYSDGVNALLSMASWGSAIYKRMWALKDSLSAATTVTEVNTVMADLNNGWPT